MGKTYDEKVQEIVNQQNNLTNEQKRIKIEEYKEQYREFIRHIKHLEAMKKFNEGRN